MNEQDTGLVELNRQLAESEDKIKGMRQEIEDLEIEQARIKNRLEEVEIRRRRLVGTPYSSGLLEVEEAKKSKIETSIKLSQNPSPVFLSEDSRKKYSEYRIAKVTKKRIYLQAPGESRETQAFDIETGERVQGWISVKLDIKATLEAFHSNRQELATAQ